MSPVDELDRLLIIIDAYCATPTASPQREADGQTEWLQFDGPADLEADSFNFFISGKLFKPAQGLADLPREVRIACNRAAVLVEDLRARNLVSVWRLLEVQARVAAPWRLARDGMGGAFEIQKMEPYLVCLGAPGGDFDVISRAERFVGETKDWCAEWATRCLPV